MKRFLLIALITSLIAFITAQAESYTSILKKTKDTANKIEIRNQDQCDNESEIFLQTSRMRREFCDYDN